MFMFFSSRFHAENGKGLTRRRKWATSRSISRAGPGPPGLMRKPPLPPARKAFCWFLLSLAWQRGAGADIPADAILRFDVELVVEDRPGCPARRGVLGMDEAEMRRRLKPCSSSRASNPLGGLQK
jgi:hypothetical protein